MDIPADAGFLFDKTAVLVTAIKNDPTYVECMSDNAKYIILRNPLFKKLTGQCS
jgi:hypothetical protein